MSWLIAKKITGIERITDVAMLLKLDMKFYKIR